MSHQYINESVNIDIYPELDKDHLAKDNAQITVGDLHGNAVKLLYILVRHAMINISPEDYKAFVEIYRKDVKALSEQDINALKQIVAKINVNGAAKSSKLSLIGDVLADRGMNDLFTLALLKKLKTENLPVDILISNHDAEFLNAYEKDKPFNSSMLGNGQAKSAFNLQSLIEKGLIARKEIVEMVESSYKPNLKLIQYSLNETQDRITIYSHAAIGVKNIQIMAARLGVEYQSGDAKTIARTIEAMNYKFTQEYVNSNKVSDLLELDKIPSDALNGIIAIKQETFPFAHLIWNRYAGDLERPDYIDFVHGHDKSDLTQKNIYNLDNDLGKAITYHNGLYNILYSNEMQRKLQLPLAVAESLVPVFGSSSQPKSIVAKNDYDEIKSRDVPQENAGKDYQAKLENLLKHEIIEDYKPMMTSSRASDDSAQSVFIGKDGEVTTDLSKSGRMVPINPQAQFVCIGKDGKVNTDLSKSGRIVPFNPQAQFEIDDFFMINAQDDYTPGYKLVGKHSEPYSESLDQSIIGIPVEKPENTQPTANQGWFGGLKFW